MHPILRYRNLEIALLFACLACVVATPANATLLIDDYNLPAPAAALSSNGIFGPLMRTDILPSPVPYAHPVRDASVAANVGGLVTATIGNGALVNASSTAAGGRLNLLYHLGLPRDYTALGGSQLDLDFVSIFPIPAISLTATVNGVSTTGPLALPLSGVPTTFSIPFAAFSIPPALTFVSSLDLTFTFAGAGFLTLNTVTVPMTGVPEPAAVSIWLLVGLCGIGLVRLCQRWQ